MAKPYVLDRVASDLARGCTHPAIQRLSSLVAAHPHDLDLRRRLAAAYRRVGNRIQAGRWDYLTIGADSRDTRAFERAFPSAVARLREVRWPRSAGQAATDYARRRLAKLMAAAAAEQPAVRPETPPSVRPAPALPARVLAAVRSLGRPSARPATNLAAGTALLVAATLVTVGLTTVIQWVVQ
jgi:Bacterial transcriptional activator domain